MQPVSSRRRAGRRPHGCGTGSSGAAVRMPSTPIEKLPRIVCEPSTSPRIAGVITRTFCAGVRRAEVRRPPAQHRDDRDEHADAQHRTPRMSPRSSVRKCRTRAWRSRSPRRRAGGGARAPGQARRRRPGDRRRRVEREALALAHAGRREPGRRRRRARPRPGRARRGPRRARAGRRRRPAGRADTGAVASA